MIALKGNQGLIIAVLARHAQNRAELCRVVFEKRGYFSDISGRGPLHNFLTCLGWLLFSGFLCAGFSF